MAVADIIILAVVGLSFLFGLWRGFIREIFSLLFWIGALVLATMFAPRLTEILAGPLSGITTSASVLYLTSFVLIFVLTVFIGGVITNLIARITNVAGVKLTDRLLGSLFGILRGIVIVTLVVMLTEPFEEVQGYYADSVILPHVMPLAAHLEGLLELLPDMSVPADTV